METKTIKLSKENYLWLLKIASELQKDYNKPVSFDLVVSTMREGKMKKKKNIMDFAGKWGDISDKDAEEIISGIRKFRKKSTLDLLKNDIY